MRIGNNPLRNSQAPSSYKDVVFVVVTHLPADTSDYHNNRMSVIQTCLETMRNNAHRDHTFIVWDNGSKSGLRSWLEHTFKPDMLILSPNIGKTAARTSVMNMIPIDTIVCYSDDDILYYDNWLKPQLELLYTYPNVACVSGYPVRTMFRWGCENTVRWAKENAKIEQGRFISREYEDDYAISIGRDPKEHVTYSLKDVDYRITYNGKQAYATSHHCQFIGYAIKVKQAMEYDNMAMGDEKPLDYAMDNIGLRLCTTERYTRHMGNVLDDKLRMELEEAIKV